MAKPLVCECGECNVCKARERARQQREENPEHVRALDSARYYRDYDKRRAAADAYQQTPEGRQKVREASRRWNAANREKRLAQNRARRALKAGKIERGPCEREAEGECRGRIEMHHDDYAKPLEVRWLCASHHGETRRRGA